MSTMMVVDGWAIAREDDGDATVADEELARHLGFARPRDIRKLAERMLSTGLLNDSEVRATVAQTSARGGRPGKTYRFTRLGALLITTQSETSKAISITREIVRVFDAVLSKPALPVAPMSLPLDIAHGARVGDLTTTKRQLADECTIAANASGRSLRAIHGYLRKCFGIPGVHHLSLFLLPNAVMLLKEISTKRLLLPTKRGPVLKLVAKDPRQIPLPLAPPT